LIFKTPNELMTDSAAASPWHTRTRLLSAAGALIGVLLFVYTLRAAGPNVVLDGIRRVGGWFLLVLALSGLRMIVRAKAWSLCVEEAGQLPFRHALAAFITGDAIGNLTPLGPVASESTKAILSRRSLPASAAVSSVILENLFYGLSVVVMVFIGTLAFLLGFRPTEGILTVTVIVGAAALMAAIGAWWALTTRPRLVSRLLRRDAARIAEERIYQFASARRDRLTRILLFEFAFHAAAVLEVFVLLCLLVGISERTLLLSLVLETVQRMTTIAFKFVPLRLGVDQAGSGLTAQVLGIGSATGITLATIRTARNLVWALVGLGLLAITGSRRVTR
jgi:hypothetical protein